MFTLIKREIEIIAPCLIALIVFMLVIIYRIIQTTDVASLSNQMAFPQQVYNSLFITLMIIPIFYTLLGFLQVYSDRQSKALVFLTTLATTRSRLITAKYIAGLCSILITCIPLIIIYLAICYPFSPNSLNMLGTFVNLALILFLANFACYNLGSLLGWNSGNFALAFGPIGLSIALLLIIMIKGISVATVVLLLLVAISTLALNWLKFKSLPLA